MTRTIDVTGLPEHEIQTIEARVKSLRERPQRSHHPLYIADATPEERVARWLELVAEFSDNDAVIADDRREALYADQPKW